jgi:cytochrome c oxidase subunit 2
VGPVGRKIRFLTTANDVIHSWWVPDLGWKKDAIPGFINESWARIDRAGTYRGQCTELCGVGHGFMPIVLQALPDADFQHWLDGQRAEQAASAAAAAQSWTRDALVKRGQEIFNGTCAACHQPTGLGIPGVFPAIKGSKIATGPLPVHLQIVLNGKPGTAMQAFGEQLPDGDLAAVITFERNAFGNDTGDLVQPADVRAARGSPAPEAAPGAHQAAEVPR